MGVGGGCTDIKGGHFDETEVIVNLRQTEFEGIRDVNSAGMIGARSKCSENTTNDVHVPCHIPSPMSLPYSNLLFNFNSNLNSRLMPNHQSNNNDNIFSNYENINNTHCRQTLLNLRYINSNNTDLNIIQTTTLSNNQINNYNSELRYKSHSQHNRN